MRNNPPGRPTGSGTRSLRRTTHHGHDAGKKRHKRIWYSTRQTKSQKRQGFKFLVYRMFPRAGTVVGSVIHDTNPLDITNYEPMCYKCHNDYDRPADLSAKISASLIGNTRRVGVKDSDETRARKSASKIGNTNRVGVKDSDETRARKSASMIDNTFRVGAKDSDETRARKSAARKAYLERKRMDGTSEGLLWHWLREGWKFRKIGALPREAQSWYKERVKYEMEG